MAVDAEDKGLCRSEGYAVPRGIPRGGAGQYDVVTVAEPFWGFRAERENDMLDLGVYVVTAEEPAVGSFGRLRFPLNDSR